MGIRSAVTGRFGSKADAAAHPDTTITETVRPQRSVDEVAQRLAHYVDDAQGGSWGEAYDADPAFWRADAQTFLTWLHG